MNGVGTGPYTFRRPPRTAWSGSRNPKWWATAALNLNVAPTYIVDIVNSSNNVALGQLLSGASTWTTTTCPASPRSSNGG